MDVMRLSTLPAVSAVLALALCGTASAQDYCVAKPRCIGTAIAAPQFAAQLLAAQSNGAPDRFFLGTGTFAIGPLTYSSAEPVEIHGQQGGGTILQSAVAGRTVLAVAGSAASSVSDLKIELAIDAGFGLDLSAATARGVTVTQLLGAQAGAGVLVGGGATLADSSVAMTSDAVAVGATSGEATVTDSTLASHRSAALIGGIAHLTLARDTLAAPVGVLALNGSATVTDTLIDGRTGLGSSIGLASSGINGATSAIVARRVTIVGVGDENPSAFGAYAVSDNRGAGTIQLRDSAITATGTPLVRAAAGAPATATIAVDRVAHGDPVAGARDTGPGSIVELRRLPAPTGFVDAVNGDFHLRADSPLVDAGDPAFTLAEAARDRDGAPRLADGDADCVARVDVGAFERQRLLPRAVATAGAATAQTGAAVSFSAAGSCAADPAGPLTYAWRFDDGALAGGPQAEHAFATAGAHTATVAVTDAAGHAAEAIATVTVTAPPLGGPGGPGGPGSDRTKPVLSGLRVPVRVTLGRALPRLRAPRGAVAIAFRLSEPASVRLTFARRGRGGRFTAVRPSLRVQARAGANRLAFAGRLTRRARLAPGRYRVSVTATDAAGNAARAQTRSLRIAAVR
jgi:PKD domain